MGVTWKLPLSETSALLATSCSVNPPSSCLGAVDINVQFGIVGLLLDAQIGNAADMAEFFKHLVGDVGICRDVRTVNLDIDRRRQAKVQSLGHNIRREKVERGSGKSLWQFVAKSPDIIRGRMMLLFQRDQNVRICCAGKA